MKCKKVDVPIYNGKLIMFKVDNWDKINKKYGFDLDKRHSACVFYDLNKQVAVAFKEYTPSIIAHEAVHVVNHIFKDRGIYLDVDNDETQAYLTGWVVKTINKFLS